MDMQVPSETYNDGVPDDDHDVYFISEGNESSPEACPLKVQGEMRGRENEYSYEVNCDVCRCALPCLENISI